MDLSCWCEAFQNAGRDALGSALRTGIIAFARLDDQIFLAHRDVDQVIRRIVAGTIGCVGQAVLVSQLFFDLCVDLFDGKLLFHFEKLTAGLLG